ncbi:hypothetical protein BaRGS_00004110 [Batillaria attramentaria]|uniref:Uncharacterized protein n=1 Tax=Batillaria attramentaria TaxID=370345 RepID=A0ABD0M022_9CAEN
MTDEAIELNAKKRTKWKKNGAVVWVEKKWAELLSSARAPFICPLGVGRQTWQLAWGDGRKLRPLDGGKTASFSGDEDRMGHEKQLLAENGRHVSFGNPSVVVVESRFCNDFSGIVIVSWGFLVVSCMFCNDYIGMVSTNVGVFSDESSKGTAL